MKFLKLFIPVFILLFCFMSLGGIALFDFSRHFYAAMVIIALLISIVVYVFVLQEEKIERLENRIEELEKHRLE